MRLYYGNCNDQDFPLDPTTWTAKLQRDFEIAIRYGPYQIEHPTLTQTECWDWYHDNVQRTQREHWQRGEQS